MSQKRKAHTGGNKSHENGFARKKKLAQYLKGPDTSVNDGTSEHESSKQRMMAMGAMASPNPSLATSTGQSNKDVTCPICLTVFSEAFVTKCGHSFCYTCIKKHLSSKHTCPTCSVAITMNDVSPNYSLNGVVSNLLTAQNSPSDLVQTVAQAGENGSLSLEEINSLITTLSGKRRQMQLETTVGDLQVCADFLAHAYKKREEEKDRLEEEMETISEDWQAIKTKICDTGAESDTYSKTPQIAQQDVPANRRRRIYTHFGDLEQAYFETHRKFEGKPKLQAIQDFQQSLSKFSRYSKFRVFSQLKYGNIFHTSSIVSSIDFDRDGEYFATAGVTKMIKVYEYQSIVEHPDIDHHQPVKEMAYRSKISCLNWSPYLKEKIASSDYEGIVSIWDAYTGQRLQLLEEHEKRAWSVDFSPAKPTCLASGSDDAKVKIWSINQQHSVATISSKANVCCVKFNPESSHHLAFGSADHHIHYYDIRNLKQELFIFRGHAKAVSYVKFLSADELVSASTDSTLKLWSATQNECKRTFTGHINEKNFVGLTTCKDYIACGSENNAVYAYYRSLSKPVVYHKFGQQTESQGQMATDDTNNFVSAVCWKKDTGALLAANSLGVISIMSLA